MIIFHQLFFFSFIDLSSWWSVHTRTFRIVRTLGVGVLKWRREHNKRWVCSVWIEIKLYSWWNFLLLLAHCNNTRFQQKDLNLAISIKIGQNYKSTTFLSEHPLNYIAIIPSFFHSLIGSMIQKKSRNSIKRRIIFFCIRPSYTELLP